MSCWDSRQTAGQVPCLKLQYIKTGSPSMAAVAAFLSHTPLSHSTTHTPSYLARGPAIVHSLMESAGAGLQHTPAKIPCEQSFGGELPLKVTQNTCKEEYCVSLCGRCGTACCLRAKLDCTWYLKCEIAMGGGIAAVKSSYVAL